ncbi:LuxR C-terminal-related transcriptional regulator [Mesorhizobium sp. SB112]|uniref:helix-turn-helix transcriptional regulator n=1 Tax=Mesorhizobium sp. SB112 TaxID=3151853 RepID=UPI003267A006
MDSNFFRAMIGLAAKHEERNFSAQLTSRGDLTSFFMQLAERIGADSYMLVAMVHDQDKTDARIIASNWVYDAIELAGRDLITILAQSQFAFAPGTIAQSLHTARAPEFLDGQKAKLLDIMGHSEIYSLRLNVGRQPLYVLFSADEEGAIETALLAMVQLQCCYALSQISGMLTAAALEDPLSDRERECLFWVSEGKTTDDVSVILGVSANTVNAYITSVIRKLSATNRAMAIATAIRNGII